jgi:glycosyltransferase involved in cell wall biosynthesis
MRRGPESETQKSGIGRYGDKAERSILAHGAGCSSVYFMFSKDLSLRETIRKGFIDPLMQLINNNKSDICHATDELSGIFLPLARGKKVVTFHHVTRHNEDISGRPGHMLWRLAARIALRSADVVLAASPQTRDEMVERYKMDPNSIEVLTAEIGEQFRNMNAERSKTVLCVSSLIKRKNIAALIRSFNTLTKMPGMSDAELIICGRGSEYENLVQLTKELGLEGNTEFVSGLSDDEIVRLYNSASVSVLPTSHEGLGLTMIEAQRCHTPVLYFKDAQIPEEVTRYAVPCAGEDDMAEKMFKCLSDEGYRDGIADAAFSYANGFGKDFGDKLFGIYEKLVRR